MPSKNQFIVSLDLTRGETHRILVNIKAQGDVLPSHIIFPAWTPGSYMVREYARHVTSLEHGQKINKSTWALKPGLRELSYEVYAFDRSVRTSYLDPNYAVLVGASILPLLPGSFEVQLKTPRSWSIVDSGLGFRRKSPGFWSAVARDADHWIDSPIVAAHPDHGATVHYRAGGIPHSLTWVGTECAKPLKVLVKDCATICETTIKMFGAAPFKRYSTLLHFGHKMYGGLEHRDSQLSQFDGAALLDGKSYEDFLGLFAHEYFHSWNVKSLRPEALGPFNYAQENYSEDLWFAEGLTNYFDELLIHWAGITSKENYWKRRCKALSQHPDGLPGHKRRSLAEASYDAWIRYYRPDEDSGNTDVSYYLKGEQLGLCWDAHLQKKSRGRWTLARLMRAFWREFGIDATIELAEAKPGYTRDELFSFAEEKTGIAQKLLLEKWVNQRAPLPWRDALEFFGVTTKENVSDQPSHLWGAQLQARNNALFVQKVYSGSAAESAGLSAGDEVVAVGTDRVADMDGLNAVLKKSGPQKLSLLIARLNKVSTRQLQPRKHHGLGEDIEFRSVK